MIVEALGHFRSLINCFSIPLIILMGYGIFKISSHLLSSWTRDDVCIPCNWIWVQILKTSCVTNYDNFVFLTIIYTYICYVNILYLSITQKLISTRTNSFWQKQKKVFLFSLITNEKEKKICEFFFSLSLLQGKNN